MKSIPFEREEEKSYMDYRLDQNLRDIEQIILDSREPQRETATYIFTETSFHIGGFYYISLAAILWWVESQLGILAFLWRIF